jgi:hypothetical protein
MKRVLFFIILGVFSFFPLFAQTPRNVHVWVAPIEGGSDEEKEYFYENMRMELVGGGYALAESLEDSDFYMNTQVVHEEEEGEPINYLKLSLYESRNREEIITLSWDYNNLEDMDIWNLYLIFQTMANAPISKSLAGSGEEAAPAPSNGWQHKWLWVGVSGGAGYFFSDNPFAEARLTFGFDFLKFMGVSTGLGYHTNFPLFVETEDRYYHELEQSLVLPLKLRFLLDAGGFLIEPNAGVQFAMHLPGSFAKGLSHKSSEDSTILYPMIIGGVDLRLKLWQGALELGTRVISDLETSSVGLGFTLGYQFGFLPKRPKAQPAALPVREENVEDDQPEEAAQDGLPETGVPQGSLPETGAQGNPPEAGVPEETSQDTPPPGSS